MTLDILIVKLQHPGTLNVTMQVNVGFIVMQ